MYRYKLCRHLMLAAVAALLMNATHAALAGTIVLDAIDSGWYDSTGYHGASNTNYFTGDKDDDVEYRSFFVFEVPTSVTASNRTLLSADLKLYNPSGGYSSPNLTERFNATLVSTDVATLRAGGSGLTGIFNDLGVGTGQVTFAQRTINATEVGRTITVDLGSAANGYIRAKVGAEYAVGGALDTLGATGDQESVFGYTTSSSTRQLVLNVADANLTGSNAAFGHVLVGMNKYANVTVTNTGESGSTLTGSIGASSDSEITPTSGSIGFSLAAGASGSRTFTYTPTERGYDSASIPILSNDGNMNLSASGYGVAPVGSVNTSSIAAGNVRLGTSAIVSGTIQNTGDGNLSGVGSVSNLRGDFLLYAGSSEFSGADTGSISLSDSATQTISYTYTPTDRTADARTMRINFYNGSTDGRNQANARTITFTGNGVGPEFASSLVVGSTIDFGGVPSGDMAAMPMTLWNSTPDGDLGSLTDLTIYDIIFSGPDSSLFSLGSSIVGTVLAAGESLVFDVLFQSDVPFGPKSATLTIITDQNAAFGSAGDAFSFQLQGIAVPEPASLALLGLGAIGLIGCRWRRGLRGVTR